MLRFILTNEYRIGDIVHGALYFGDKPLTASKYWNTTSIIRAEQLALKETQWNK
jgi:hypothetical protein